MRVEADGPDERVHESLSGELDGPHISLEDGAGEACVRGRVVFVEMPYERNDSGAMRSGIPCSMSSACSSFDRLGPFAGVGWLARGVHEEGLIGAGKSANILSERGRSLCVRLLERTPRLSLCGGGHWTWPAGASADSETQLAALLADNDFDWTRWIIDTEPAGAATTVWDRARRAAHRGDAGTVRDELGAAWRQYSPAGHRMLSAGVLNLLALRIEQQAEH